MTVPEDTRTPNQIRLDKIIIELQKLNKTNEIIGNALVKLLEPKIIDPKAKKVVDKK